MNSKYSTLALVVMLATGLAACSKNHPKSIKAQAEVAKATGKPEDQKAVYDRADEAIETEQKNLDKQGLELGFWGKVKSRFVNSVKAEDRGAAKKSLNAIVENSETQIGLAKKLNDDLAVAHAELIKSQALEALDRIDAEVENDQAKEKARDEAAQSVLTGP